MTWQSVAQPEDLPAGSVMRVDVGGVPVCLAHVEGEGFFAIGDTCTHEEQSLSEGDLLGCEVECVSHGSLFDVRTGEVSGVPAREAAQTFEVRVVESGVEIRSA